jgi:hypothetical protein
MNEQIAISKKEFLFRRIDFFIWGILAGFIIFVVYWYFFLGPYINNCQAFRDSVITCRNILANMSKGVLVP